MKLSEELGMSKECERCIEIGCTLSYPMRHSAMNQPLEASSSELWWGCMPSTFYILNKK